MAHRTPDAEDTKSCTLRMTRVIFRVSSSPFLLAATIRNHLKKYQTSHPQTVNTLKNSLYVDDFIASSSDVEGAYALTTSAREILSTAGMNLCK